MIHGLFIEVNIENGYAELIPPRWFLYASGRLHQDLSTSLCKKIAPLKYKSNLFYIAILQEINNLIIEVLRNY